MSLLSYLRPREVDDILSGRVRVVLGGQEHTLPVLTIERNETWRTAQNEALARALTGLDEQADDGRLFSYLCQQPHTLYAQIAAYERLGTDDPGLPDWPAIRAIATEAEIMAAFLEVLAAAYPLAVELIRLLESAPIAPVTDSAATAPEPTPSVPMSRSLRRSAGRRRGSAAA